MAASPRRVLVLTLSFGSGHLRAGAAVAQAIRREAPEVDVRTVDALDGCRWLFRAAYVWPYWAMVRYAPKLWDWFFSARLRNKSEHTAPDWAFSAGCPNVFREIAGFDPDVIVAAEVAASEIASIARRRGVTTASIIDVVTDHHAEPAWVKPEVESYAVGNETVRDQLIAWGAPAERVFVAGIPTDEAFRVPIDPVETRRRTGLSEALPVVLLMGGGMGPTRMDQIAEGLCASGEPMEIVAIAGLDEIARRRLEAVRTRLDGRATGARLTVLGWTNDVAALMACADVLVTKPGGVTTAEAAIARLPVVMFDAIPGPELHNAHRVAAAGAGVLTRGATETVAAVLSLLRDARRRGDMSDRAGSLGAPGAADLIAKAVLARQTAARPVLIVTIRNGAGHTRVAHAIAEALRTADASIPVRIVDAADYMSWLLRATHIRIYLWLVRYAPRLWARIDRYQKRQPHTSPEWYYRQGCKRLFELVARLQPRAIVATEVGCCEMAALFKRDLDLPCPLVAVNGEYDADRAWVQPEVDLYSVPSPAVQRELCRHGAPAGRVHSWGVPLAAEFHERADADAIRVRICQRLDLSPARPLVLVSGGSEGLGRPDIVAAHILELPAQPQVVVLAGRNVTLRRRAEALACGTAASRLRVLGWTDGMSSLMRAADVMVSKLGHTFDEAMAVGLPVVALEPPPGSEEVQYALMRQLGGGIPVRTLEEMVSGVEQVLAQGRRSARQTPVPAPRTAANQIAQWLVDAMADGAVNVLAARVRVEAAGRLRAQEGQS